MASPPQFLCVSVIPRAVICILKLCNGLKNYLSRYPYEIDMNTYLSSRYFLTIAHTSSVTMPKKMPHWYKHIVGKKIWTSREGIDIFAFKHAYLNGF